MANGILPVRSESAIDDAAPHEAPGLGRAIVGLVAGAAAMTIAAGGLLWWRYGGAVFNDMVVAGLAWCF